MGLAIDLSSFLLETRVSVQRFDVLAPNDELLRKIDGMLARVGRMGREVDALYQDVLSAGQAYERLVAAARDEISDGGPENLDQIISELLSIEREYADQLIPRIQHSERFLSKALKDEMLVTAGLVPVLKREIAAMYLMLEQIRDARWQFMTIRAEVGRGGTLPATDQAADLAKQLKALRR
jgi:hypothetical protein